MADCGREGGNFSRRRSAKRRERSVRRDRREVRGVQVERGVFFGGGGEIKDAISGGTSVFLRLEDVATGRSCGRAGNVASSHSPNVSGDVSALKRCGKSER